MFIMCERHGRGVIVRGRMGGEMNNLLVFCDPVYEDDQAGEDLDAKFLD